MNIIHPNRALPTVPMEAAPDILGDNFRMDQVIPVVGDVVARSYVDGWQQVYFTTVNGVGEEVSNRRIIETGKDTLYFQSGDDATGNLMTVGADEELWAANIQADRADRLRKGVGRLNMALSAAAAAECEVRGIGGQGVFDGEGGSRALAELEDMLQRRRGSSVLASILAAAKDAVYPVLKGSIDEVSVARDRMRDIRFPRQDERTSNLATQEA